MRLNVRWRILPPHISPAGQIFVSCMGTCIDACMGCECVCLRVRACAHTHTHTHQIIHLQAAKMLDLSEKDFTRALELGEQI